MWLVARALPGLAFAVPARQGIAAAMIVAGLLAGVLGVASFRRARTTLNPMAPGMASSLVVSGVYRLTRNPIYLGLLLILAGWAVVLANALAFLILPAFVLYMNRWQIAPGERALAARFGPSFAAYRSRVRRWL
jgi:protein-S-isoprenylcysteine O-methyltransferase Ste14